MAYGSLKADTIIFDDNGADVNVSVSALAGAGSAAPLNNPVFTGTPEAPTPTSGTNTAQIATTEFVQTSAGTLLPLAGGTMTGDIILAADPHAALKPATKQYVDTNTVSLGLAIALG